MKLCVSIGKPNQPFSAKRLLIVSLPVFFFDLLGKSIAQLSGSDLLARWPELMELLHDLFIFCFGGFSVPTFSPPLLLRLPITFGSFGQWHSEMVSLVFSGPSLFSLASLI